MTCYYYLVSFPRLFVRLSFFWFLLRFAQKFPPNKNSITIFFFFFFFSYCSQNWLEILQLSLSFVKAKWATLGGSNSSLLIICKFLTMKIKKDGWVALLCVVKGTQNILRIFECLAQMNDQSFYYVIWRLNINFVYEHEQQPEQHKEKGQIVI